MTLGDLKVSVDSLTILPRILPDFGAGENFCSRLSLTLHASGSSATTSGVVLVNLLDKMWCVLLSNAESISVHLGFLVHLDRLVWLLGVDVALLSLAEVTSFEERLALVHENLGHALGVVLAGNLEC